MSPDAYVEMAQSESIHWWFRGRRAVVKTFLQPTLQASPRAGTARILEVGAGTGGNLALLRELGDVVATEMEPTARALASQKLGRPVLDGRLPDAMPDLGSDFDLVCMFDVLEHVQDDVGSLLRAAQYLRPGGRLVVTVPAHQWLWSTHDVRLHHQRRYSRQQLLARLREAGLSADRITYFNCFAFPAAVLARFADRFSGAHTAAGTKVPPPPVNAAMNALMRCEAALASSVGLPFGMSLLVVASPVGG